MQLNDPIFTAYFLVLAGVLGLVVGSFVNCWAWRYVHGESIVAGRSHCTSCGHELGARDLIPVVSWLLSRGKCRYCGEKVSARYPLTEVVCAVVFVAITAVYGISLETLELLAFAGILLFLSLTDLDKLIIPNGCIIAALGVRIVYLAVSCALGTMGPGQVIYFVGSAFGVGIVMLLVVLAADRVFRRESMGGGDLKLYFVAAFYFGWQQCFFLVIVSCIIGIVVGVLSPRPDTQDEDEGVMRRTIPFGPSIAAACIVTMLVGPTVITWYLGLF